MSQVTAVRPPLCPGSMRVALLTCRFGAKTTLRSRIMSGLALTKTAKAAINHPSDEIERVRDSVLQGKLAAAQ